MSRISKMLKAIIEKDRASIRAIARAIGVDHASLSRSLKDDGNPESRTIEKILDYFGYDLKFKKRREVKPKPKPSRSKGKGGRWNGDFR
jgi:DNA-binding phage protein